MGRQVISSGQGGGVGARPGRRSTVEIVLAGLLLAVALPAVAGGIGLLTGVIEPPAEDLADTPFDSYVIPGVLLAVVVGGSSAIASAAVWRRHRLGPAVALVAGLGLMIWIVVQMTMIQFSPLQPAYLVAGAAIAALAIVLLRPARRAP